MSAEGTNSSIWLYVDPVLRARDVLLDAEIRVIRYDLYPHHTGAVLIPTHDRKRAIDVLANRRIRVSQQIDQ